MLLGLIQIEEVDGPAIRLYVQFGDLWPKGLRRGQARVHDGGEVGQRGHLVVVVIVVGPYIVRLLLVPVVAVVGYVRLLTGG